ncbi:MAG: TonB-dependent receptor, partial [Myxococcales bacterium]|nr:TonB-dependent receptor [Myxococcales bacterium]
RFVNENAAHRQLGGELGLRAFPARGVDLHASYALHETSPMDAPAQLGRELDQRTSRHKLSAGLQYRSPIGLDLSLDLQWVSSQVWAIQVTDLERGGIVFQPFELPSYHVLSARVGYRFADEKLDIGIVGTNLTDPGHREHPFGQPVPRRFLLTLTARI